MKKRYKYGNIRIWKEPNLINGGFTQGQKTSGMQMGVYNQI